jgi:hypothetical protein
MVTKKKNRKFGKIRPWMILWHSVIRPEIANDHGVATERLVVPRLKATNENVGFPKMSKKMRRKNEERVSKLLRGWEDGWEINELIGNFMIFREILTAHFFYFFTHFPHFSTFFYYNGNTQK